MNRDENGVTGVSLTAKPEHYAECYCLSFVSAQQKGNATVKFEGGKIVFDHKGASDDKLGVFGYSDGGIFTAEISPEDQEALESLMSRTGKYANAEVRVKYEMAFSRGFTLYATLAEQTRPA